MKVFFDFYAYIGAFCCCSYQQQHLIGYVLLSMVGFFVNAITSIKKEFVSKWGKVRLFMACTEAYKEHIKYTFLTI